MSTVHPQINVHCGDDWQFSGTLTDNNGNVLPLTGASFIYRVDSLDGSVNYYNTTAVSVTSIANGTVYYAVPEATTVNLSPGTYYDCLRVTLASAYGGGTFTVIEGVIRAMPQL